MECEGREGGYSIAQCRTKEEKDVQDGEGRCNGEVAPEEGSEGLVMYYEYSAGTATVLLTTRRIPVVDVQVDMQGLKPCFLSQGADAAR